MIWQNQQARRCAERMHVALPLDLHAGSPKDESCHQLTYADLMTTPDNAHDNAAQNDTQDITPFSALAPHVVLNAVEATGRRCDARLLALNSYENRVWQVGLDDAEPLIAKFYRPGRWSDAAILEEHRFTAELAALEIPVVPPLTDANSHTLHHHDGLRFALYPRCSGRTEGPESPTALAMLGRHLGRIHAVGALRPFTHRPPLSVAEFGHACRDFLLANELPDPSIRDNYEAVTAQLLMRIKSDFPALDAFPSLRLHGDCHPGNLLWHNAIPNFVDFDDARTGPAIQDLWMMLSGTHGQRTAQLLDLLEGYEQFMPFAPRELVLIEPLRTLRIIHHAAWIGRRWADPAFPLAFPDFATPHFWSSHMTALREQQSALEEPPLTLPQH